MKFKSLAISALVSVHIATCGDLTTSSRTDLRTGVGSTDQRSNSHDVDESDGDENPAPLVASGIDPVVYLSSATAHLEMTASDPEGGELAYEWHVLSGPGNVTFSAPKSLATDATFSAAGVYHLRMSATGAKGIGADTMRVVVIDDSPAWFKKAGVLRERYVAPNATGSGQSPQDPMSAESAFTAASPGDLFWFAGGTYKKATFYDVKTVGTEANPIVYRATPGQHAIIEGSVKLFDAKHVWIWGFELTDPLGSNMGPSDGISLLGAGTRAINNVVHHQFEKNGIGAWNGGAGQVVYGNIIYNNGNGTNHPHGIYTANRFEDYGLKYIVGNITAAPCNNGCFIVHAYTEGGYITGFQFEKNIFAAGRFILGGRNAPHYRNTIDGNYFLNAPVKFGISMPMQTVFTKNHLLNTEIVAPHFWGLNDPSANFPKPLPNNFSFNRFYGSSYFDISVMGWTGVTRTPVTLDPGDIFNNNSYPQDFTGYLTTTGTKTGFTGIAAWQALTASSGAAFDTDSRTQSDPELPQVAVIQNAYEPDRLHIVINDAQRAGSVAVDLSEYIPYGYEYRLQEFKDLWGTPVANGVYDGPISVSVPGPGYRILVAFIVKPNARQGGKAPHVSFAKPGSAIVAGKAVRFDGAVDKFGAQNSDDIKCLWKVTSGFGSAAIQSPADTSTNITFAAYGEHEVEFGCDDGAGRVARYRKYVNVAGSADITQGLFSQFKFDGNSTDTLPNTGQVTVGGAPTFAAGKSGNAIVFNGTTDSLTLQKHVGNLAADFSISVWVHSAAGAGDGPIIGNFSGATSAGIGQGLQVYAGKLRYHASESLTPPCDDTHALIQGPTIADGTWHHVGLAFDKARAVSKLYFDGILVATADMSGLLPQCLPGMAKIGGGTQQNSAVDYFPGMIDELRIYDRVLSDGQMRAQATEF